MKFSLKELKRLSVETKSGIVLGKIVDFLLESDGGVIYQYKVKGSFFSTKEFLVNREQIIEITEEKMIVYDAVVRRGLEPENEKTVLSEPALSRKIDS